MKRLLIALLLLCLSACSSGIFDNNLPYDGDEDAPGHALIVLGEQLKDPYTVENMALALKSLYPSKAGIVALEATDYYVRFLPENQADFDLLQSLGVQMIDHPLDYSIIREGDYYKDPSVGDDRITWQYAVVDTAFVFPEDIRYEIIDDCYIADHDTKAGTMTPEGRITIVDDDYDSEPVGVAGVRVSCNSFVKIANAYTDEEGYYKMNRSYSSNVRYRLVFRNVKGFSIGFNLILVPASVSSLGKHEATGYSATIDSSSERKLFCRCVVNNAGYDYWNACSAKDAKIKTPPSDFRLWLFQKLNVSLPAMLQQGTLIDNSVLGEYLGIYSVLLKMFLSDSMLSLKGKNTYSEIYAEALHQFAHGSHFMNVGTKFWDNLVKFDVMSFLSSGRIFYGVGTESGHEYCELAEMWAYYMQTVLYRERYKDSDASFGTQFRKI